MSNVVVEGSSLECPWGEGPKKLAVVPPYEVKADGKQVATVTHIVPMADIPSFGQCKSLSNPLVAAATAAASGVLQPQPCVPVIASPWLPGAPTVLLNGMPVLNEPSICLCAWAAGLPIRIANSAVQKINLP